jgi:hypothetical protein
MTDKILEIVTFRIAEGVSEEAVLSAANAIMPWLKTQHGFIDRSLSVDDNGEWLDRVTWRDYATAMAAGEKVMSEESAAPFMAMILPETMVMRHFHIKLES